VGRKWNDLFYQDKLGSTTHVANASGHLLESYRYDLYGTPAYYDALNNKLSTSNYSVHDLYAGERWVSALGIYDLRNRFMSPELGRFLQADPIGFKGDGSNLYRYCHNNPTNFTDPMGLLAGFTRYSLEYDKNEVQDDTHDGYQVKGVPGYENKPGDRVHLEVDRSVTTVKDRIDGSDKGGGTRTKTTASEKDGIPTIHHQIDVRYAGGAGAKFREFTRNNEWTHSRDSINSVNALRSTLAGWVGSQNMTGARALNFIRNGEQFGRYRVPSLVRYDAHFVQDQKQKWDNSIFPPNNSWLAPNGQRVAPHTPIDPYTGNPLNWNE
jgi:RHS repeat-associated protein